MRMPLGLGKSEKRREEDGQAVPEDDLEGNEDTAAAAEDEAVDGDPVSESPAAEGQAEQTGEYRPMAFRPAFLDGPASHEGTAVASPTPPNPKGDAFFVSVARQDTTEIRRFDDPSEAQTFLEALLEEGVPQGDVAAFSGRRLTLKVSHRPVVKLSSSQED